MCDLKTQTDKLEHADKEFQCDSVNMISVYVSTNNQIGVDAACNTEPPCSRHKQTTLVAMQHKKIGRNTICVSSQTDADALMDQTEIIQVLTQEIEKCREAVKDKEERVDKLEHDYSMLKRFIDRIT